jgi:hypothetical protein
MDAYTGSTATEKNLFKIVNGRAVELSRAHAEEEVVAKRGIVWRCWRCETCDN